MCVDVNKTFPALNGSWSPKGEGVRHLNRGTHRTDLLHAKLQALFKDGLGWLGHCLGVVAWTVLCNIMRCGGKHITQPRRNTVALLSVRCCQQMQPPWCPY